MTKEPRVTEQSSKLEALIKSRREHLKLSQQDVASYVGVSKSAVSRWESGDLANMGLSYFLRLREILQLPDLDILLNKDGEYTVPLKGDGDSADPSGQTVEDFKPEIETCSIAVDEEGNLIVDIRLKIRI